MKLEKTVRLSHSGSNQVLHIPHRFELSSDEVVVRKEGDRLVVEPVKRPSLLAFLSTLSDINEELPNPDEGLLTLDDINI
mgnify:CR=1 FL=1